MTQIAFTAPHQKAAEIGHQLLREGHNAVDAMIAAAAAVSVLYPHMNSVGGDGFWLIHRPGEKPFAIDGCGRAAAEISPLMYRELGFDVMPSRGGKACVTVGGTVAGWQAARQALAGKIRNQASLRDLLTPASELAKGGVKVTATLARASAGLHTNAARAESPSGRGEFSALFERNGRPIGQGELLTNPALADVFEQLAYAGLDDFYRGDLGHSLANGLQKIGSPIGLKDLQSHRADLVRPLSVTLRPGRVYNLPPPTQGVASLMMLAIYDRLWRPELSEVESIHLLVEATKQAFRLRDRHVCDPSRMRVSTEGLLSDDSIMACAKHISACAQPWPDPASMDGSVWMGCVDSKGTMVSFAQSIYCEFGAGVVVPGTGIIWNNRGASFSLDESHHSSLGGSVKPLHTMSPAYAELKDGRRVVYGTMGGDGQPQTQAAVFYRSFYCGEHVAAAIERGRWLLGGASGEDNTDLKIEEDLWQVAGKALKSRGHALSVVPGLSEVMGHAGAVILDQEGRVDGASDPRSDGQWIGD